MANTMLPILKPQFFDSDGAPLAGGYVAFYSPGTTDYKDVFGSYGSAIAITNPVPLDSAGMASIWLDGTIYDVAVYDGVNADPTIGDYGTLLYTIDNVFSYGTLTLSATFPWVDATNDTNLNGTIDAIGSTDTEVWVTSQQTLTDNLTIPANVHLRFLRDGIIVSDGYTLTIEGTIDEGLFQKFTGFSAGDVTFSYATTVYPEWWGSDAAAIKAAADSLSSGGIVKLTGTYTVANATITVTNNNVTFDLTDSAILNSTSGDTDYTIKISGSRFVIKGGTIQIPDNHSIFTGSLANLRKAVIWLTDTADDFEIDCVKFTNIATVGIFNEGADRGRVHDCKVFGGYDSYDISDGSNHFFYYQYGGSNFKAYRNYIEYCVMGFGSGTYEQSAVTRMIITENTFDHIGQHPIYIANGGDYSIVSMNTQKDCGSSFALTGNFIQCEDNNIHLDSTLWTSGTTYQSGLSFRDAIGCICKGNIITGKGYKVVLGFENLSTTTIRDNIIEGNNIFMTEGAAYQAILVGSSGTTTVNQRNKITGNNAYVPIGTVNYPIIGLYATAADQVIDCAISDNTAEAGGTTQCYAYKIYYGVGCRVHNNKAINRQTHSTSTNFYAIGLIQCHDTEVANNSILVTDATNLALFGFYESGSNTEVYDNRCIELSINSAATGGNLYPYTVIAGNGSRVFGGKCYDAFNTDTEGTHYLRKGHILYLTASGGDRNFNPGGEVYPLDYVLEIHNMDGANTITFDSTGIAQAIAAGKFGIFRYSGSAWSGGQVN